MEEDLIYEAIPHRVVRGEDFDDLTRLSGHPSDPYIACRISTSEFSTWFPLRRGYYIKESYGKMRGTKPVYVIMNSKYARGKRVVDMMEFLDDVTG